MRSILGRSLVFVSAAVLIHGCSEGRSGSSPSGDPSPSTSVDPEDPEDPVEPPDPVDPPDPVAPCATDVAGYLEGVAAPGLSAAIIKDGRLVCTSVGGAADLEAGRPVTPETVFAWASVSKIVTATALMVLYDEGRFGLDDDIDPYLPFETAIPDCATEPITFRQLLTHSSSIIDNPQVYGDSYGFGDSPVPLGDFLASYLPPEGDLYDPRWNFDRVCPGRANHYSNIGAGLIGYLVEEISGTPFDQFCQERIFGPLDMNETSWRLADLDLTHVAMPYSGQKADEYEPVGHLGFPTYPDGLLRTSAPQMARFLLMFSQLGELDGARILEASTAEEMRRVQTPELDDTQGLIWFYVDVEGRQLLGHDGSDPGTAGLVFFDPEDGAGVVLVGNTDWYDGQAGEANALFAALFEESETY